MGGMHQGPDAGPVADRQGRDARDLIDTIGAQR
jgi:hypothetical protein